MSKIKILFVYPKRPTWSKSSVINEYFSNNNQFLRQWFSPPLNLIVIAAQTPSIFELQLVDNDFEEVKFTKDISICAITAMTQQIESAYKIALQAKSHNIYTVLGGIHASVLPEEALNVFDTVFKGEAELTWKEFLEDFTIGKPRRFYSNDKIVDLTTLPMPKYELFNPAQVNRGENFFNVMPVQASRGCPLSCNFCSVHEIYGKHVRRKNVEQIVTEIECIQKLFGRRHLIAFVDDNLFIDKEFAYSLLERLIPLRIKFFAQSDISVGNDPKLLKLIYRAGCEMLLIGIETLNEQVISKVSRKKNMMFKQTKNLVKKIQENGIIVYGAFIFGFPEDTISTFDEVYQFVKECCCVGQFTFLTPLPGTQLYNTYKTQGNLLSTEFWDKSTFYDVVIKHPTISKEVFEKRMVWLHENVYNEIEFERRYQYWKKIIQKLPQRYING